MAPAYSLARQKTGTSYARKLALPEVRDMRRWARTDGFGLPIMLQAECLAAQYFIRRQTARDILANEAWHDPTFDRETPLPDALIHTVGWLTWVGYLHTVLLLCACGGVLTHGSDVRTQETSQWQK